MLAGGLGTRMRGHAGGLAKSLVPVLGEPFAHHQLRLLARQGVRDVVLVIGHGGSEIRSSIGDGGGFSVSVTYVDEGDELHGTGGALRLALDRGALSDPVGVLYGDSYLPIDLAPVWAAFDLAAHRALMAVVRSSAELGPGNANLEGDLVTRYDKLGAQLGWIDFGFNVLRRDVIEEIPAGAVVDLADVLRDLSLRRELRGYEVESRFYEVGSPEGLADLERYLATEGR